MPTVAQELARAKLTRSFKVTGRRDDGYHVIDAEMVTLALADDVEFGEGDGIEVVDEIAWSNGSVPPASVIDVLAVDNLVLTALAVCGRSAHVRLTKRIPLGAGLGGGSADAAAVLRWAGVQDLDVAAKIGSDVPFCVVGGRALVGGVGELVEPLKPVDLGFVLLTPSLSVSTASVYAAFDDLGPSGRLSSTNDLEKAALAVEPGLGRFRDLLAATSSLEPQLAGSGATWFVECAGADCEAIAEQVRHQVVSDGLMAMVSGTRTEG